MYNKILLLMLVESAHLHVWCKDADSSLEKKESKYKDAEINAYGPENRLVGGTRPRQLQTGRLRETRVLARFWLGGATGDGGIRPAKKRMATYFIQNWKEIQRKFDFPSHLHFILVSFLPLFHPCRSILREPFAIPGAAKEEVTLLNRSDMTGRFQRARSSIRSGSES